MEGLEYKPSKFFVRYMGGYTDKNKAYKKLRDSSSAYCKKVRAYILERDKYQCKNCSSTCELQIDHVIPVYYGFCKGYSIYAINCIENLQTLCRKCNASKLPDFIS